MSIITAILNNLIYSSNTQTFCNMKSDSLLIKDVLQTHLNFLKEAELHEEIQEYGQLVNLDEGSQVLTPGTYVKMVPVLLDGSIKLTRSESGKEVLIYSIHPSESCIVSINCGINEIKSYVTAVAEEPTRALLLPSRLIEDWQRKFPSFNKYVLSQYQQRFDDILNAFNAMAFLKLDSRILGVLEKKASMTKNNKLKITHQELADDVGTARETVSRILKKLEADGKVTLYRGTIELK